MSSSWLYRYRSTQTLLTSITEVILFFGNFWIVFSESYGTCSEIGQLRYNPWSFLFSETIDEENPIEACDSSLHLVVWGCWALSLFQFSFVLTAFAKQKQKHNTITSVLCCTPWSIFSNPEIWGIFVILFLQEIPFLTARIYFIFYLNIQRQTMIFFGVKNLLVVLLQIYRFLYIFRRRAYHGASQKA